MAGESTGNVERLIALATQRFGKLSDYEVRALRASGSDDCTTCQIAAVKNEDGEPVLLDNTDKADTWGEEREVRAALIRWLCVVPEASRNVAPRGIQVRGAKVRGILDVSSAAVPFPLTFMQSRFLDDIDIRYASVPLLQLTGSAIETLNADGAQVKTMVFLDEGFSAREVRMVGANIGASLNLRRARLKTLGVALHADRLEVRGDVLFNGFSSDGDVLMADAQVGGVLSCEGGKFAGVNLERTVIKRAFFWRGVQRCTSLDLSRTSMGALTDDQKSWEHTDEYRLDGLVYEHILGLDTPRGAETRLNWLSRQKAFAPQPYRQLVKVFHDIGDDNGMRQVLFELEGRIRSEERENLLAHHPIKGVLDSGADFFSWSTIGYGVYPGWAILESAGLAALGWIIFRRAYQLGAMVPSERMALGSCLGKERT